MYYRGKCCFLFLEFSAHKVNDSWVLPWKPCSFVPNNSLLEESRVLALIVAGLTMETLADTTWDVVLAGTGLPQSLLAL